MRGLTHAATLAVLLVAAALGSAAPPVEVPPEVSGDVGAFVAIRAKTDGATVRFVALDPGLNVFPADLLSDKKSTVVSASKPGRYRVLAYSAVKNDPTEPALITVVIGGAKPDPIPDPKPQPDPAPAPKVESVWVIVVEDGAGVRTLETARALNDPFWVGLKPKHDYRHYLSDSPTAKEQGYVAIAQKTGYPAVILLSAKDGDPLRSFRLGTIADLEAQVKAVTK